MIGIVAFNMLMVLLGAAAASPLVPLQPLSDALSYLHTTIGITTPPPEKVRMVAMIWVGSVIVLVDGLLFLLVSLMRVVM